MAKKESATKNESASRVQVGVAPGTETAEHVVGGSEAEGGGSSEGCPYVVGIGASAGGLQPLQEFFDKMSGPRPARLVAIGVARKSQCVN